jgi:hypothetical protein
MSFMEGFVHLVHGPAERTNEHGENHNADSVAANVGHQAFRFCSYSKTHRRHVASEMPSLRSAS